MPNTESTTQQDFISTKRPGMFGWLRNLTPKKRVLFWAAIIVSIIAIGLIIYFVFAEEEPEFILAPTSGSWEIGQSHNVGVSVSADAALPVQGIKMKISYELDGQDASSWLSVKVPSQMKDLFNEPQIDSGARTISLDSKQISGPVIVGPEEIKDVLIITLDLPKEPALVGKTLQLDFVSGENEVYTGGSITPDPDLKLTGPAIFDIINPLEKIYFEPESGDLAIDETFDIQLKINTELQDIIAFETLIKYDPAVLEMVKTEIGKEFPQGFEPEHNSMAGTFKLLRGTYGDKEPNNGTATPSQDRKGLKGTAVLATLTFKAIDFSSQTQLSINSAQVVKDDGLGSLVPFELKSGTYKILESQPVIKDLYIMPHKQVDEWHADVTWTTNNILTTSKVYYILKDDPDKACSDYNYSGAYFVKDDTFSGPQHSLTVPDPKDVDAPVLDTGKEYCVKVVATNRDGKYAEKFGEFTTQTSSTELQIINNSAQPSYNSAIITWNTIGGPNNGWADSEITSCRPDPGGLPITDSTLTLTHSIKVTGLQQDTFYTCQLLSEDKDNNQAKDSVKFTTKAGQDFDANTILKVEPDRICDKWLYCRSAVQVINSQDETENLCFDVGVCDEQGDEGGCAEQIDGDILDTEQEFSDPSQIKNLSGLSKVGFNWGTGQRVAGYKHYGVMAVEGTDMLIPNSDFESDEIWPWLDKEKDNVIIKVVNDPQNMTDKVLQISPEPDSVLLWSNARMPIGWISNQYNYAISLGIRSASSGTKNVRIQLATDRDGDGKVEGYYTIKNQPISNYWQTIILISDQSGSMFPGGSKQGEGFLNLGTRQGEAEYETLYYIDNLSMKSVLSVATEDYVSRSCRLYPSTSAPSCSYVAAAGKEYRGWQGFCVEPDPKYFNLDIEKQICLNWWPVDILPGETDVFGTDQQAGYKGRQPLYYCLESTGTGGENEYETLGSGTLFMLYKTTTPFGWEHASGIKSFSFPAPFSFYENDITQIVLEVVDREHKDWPTGTFVMNKNSGTAGCNDWGDNNSCEGVTNATLEPWTTVWCGGDEKIQCNKYIWKWGGKNVKDSFAYMISEDDHCSADWTEDTNSFAVQALFNTQGKLTGLKAGLCDSSGDKGWVGFRVKIYAKERCNVLAQVVAPDGRNVAWSNRVRDGGWLQDNDLGYEYNQDYAPYGAAVVGSPVSNPAEWEEPLFVMPANTSMGMQKPYQVRAGSPYAIDRTAPKTCQNSGKFGEYCQKDSDCDVDGDCLQDGTETTCPAGINWCCSYPPYQDCEADGAGDPLMCFQSGDCQTGGAAIEMNAECVAGSGEKLGKQCDSNADCGYSLESEGYGLCVGINLTKKQRVEIKGGWQNGIEKLKQLFAKSFKIWEWKWDYSSVPKKMRYIEQDQETNWDFTLDPISEQFKPKVMNIKVRDQASGDVIIQGPKSVILKFNASISEEHLPMTAYRVDWNDGTAMSQVNNLKIYPRTHEDNPHVLFHSYVCNTNYYETCPSEDVDGPCCIFVPRVQVQDNWGWCNESTLPSKCNGWTGFGGRVIVLP